MSAILRPLLCLLATTAALHAAVFQPIQGFESPLVRPVGKMAFDTEGNLYGFAAAGGADGAGGFFRMAPGGPVKTFSDPWWASSRGDLLREGPTRGLVRAGDGNFYGVIQQGGIGARGIIVRLTPAGVLTPVVDFYGTDAQFPSGSLIPGQDGSLYGLAQAADGIATVLYRLSLAGDFTTVRLGNGIDTASLTAAPDGGFYARRFAASTAGQIIHLALDGTITPIGTVPFQANLPYPVYLLQISALTPGPDGALYGTASTSGYRVAGLVFRLSLDGVFSPLQLLNDSTGDVDPAVPLTRGADGLLYGVTSKWIFRLNASGQMGLVRAFNEADGIGPSCPLSLSPDGSLYGALVDATTWNSFFRLTPDLAYQPLGGLAETPVTAPRTGLVQDGEGNFYGTTDTGGKNGGGILYRISADTAAISTVRDRGRSASGSLATGRDGNIYGIEYRYSPYDSQDDGFGRFIRVTSGGSATVMKDYSPSAIANCWNLVATREGDFQALAWEGGGPEDQARIVRFSRSGGINRSLPSSMPVITDTGAMSQMPDGSLVSIITTSGRPLRICRGSSLAGMGPATELALPDGSSLYSVRTNSGALSLPPVIAPDGTLYGFASRLSSGYPAILYKIVPHGTPTVVIDDFRDPSIGWIISPSSLILAKDGNLYGTSENGGNQAGGSIFRITPAGVLSTLHNFGNYAAPGGTSPAAPLLQAADGHLYGTTRSGGSTPDGRRTGGGEFYRLYLGALSQPDRPTAITWNGATLHGTVDPAGDDTTVTFQVSPDSSFRRPLIVKAGTVAAGQGTTEVSATVTRLLPNRTYWVRLVTVNAGNPVPQASEGISFTTPKRPSLREILFGQVRPAP